MLRQKVKKLDAVIFTHEHKDHLAGLDDVRAFNFLQKKAMDVYASKRVQDAIKKEFAYVFSDEKYPGIPQVNLHDIDKDSFSIGKTQFTPIEVMHHKLPVKAYRMGNISYVTDANFISETEKNKLKGSEIIIINALRKEQHISHFTFQEAIDLMFELKPKKAYFTHISHQLGVHAEIRKELPDWIELAYDGLCVESA